MKVLVFAGAGASVELGVPAMRPLLLELLDHLDENGSVANIVRKTRECLEAGYYDIEDLIEKADSVMQTSRHLDRDGELSKEEAERREEYRELQLEAEWFVQHTCEQIHGGKARLLWGSALMALREHDLWIATTNYDRAIEMAASNIKLYLSDGFGEFEGREWAEFDSIDRSASGKLLKIHGSTDWYRNESGDGVYKLRHPMPLFGEVALAVEGIGKLASAVVLPSREKIKNQRPHTELSHELWSASDVVDVAIFVGSSLRDPDIEQVCRRCERRGVAVFVVGPEAKDACGRVGIAQCASWFLVSTLPKAMRSGDPVAALRDARTQGVEGEGILDMVWLATSKTESVEDRRDAIGNMCELGVALGADLVEPLIRESDAGVAMESLGLIQESPDRDKLVEVAQVLASEGAEESVKSEVELLVRMFE